MVAGVNSVRRTISMIVNQWDDTSSLNSFGVGESEEIDMIVDELVEYE